jgi:fructokinase
VFGAIEAGGTKFVCGVGTGPADLKTKEFPTTSPEATIAAAAEFIREEARDQLRGVGIASFGPVDLDRSSPSYGHITSTPKLSWQNYDIAGAVAGALRTPIGFDTDVNGAALGEARWGAGQGLSDFVYLTVGTGIGGGAMAGGALLHGLMHPEMGHIRIPHDLARDPYPGACPFHGDCLEGLASGPAMNERWGVSGRDLPPDHPGWELEAHYLALGLANWVCSLSPKRFILGGGVMAQGHLFDRVRRELGRLLNGYIRVREITDCMDRYVVPPQLGARAGVLGALALAEQAVQRESHTHGRAAK